MSPSESAADHKITNLADSGVWCMCGWSSQNKELQKKSDHITDAFLDAYNDHKIKELSRGVQ